MYVNTDKSCIESIILQTSRTLIAPTHTSKRQTSPFIMHTWGNINTARAQGLIASRKPQLQVRQRASSFHFMAKRTQHKQSQPSNFEGFGPNCSVKHSHAAGMHAAI